MIEICSKILVKAIGKAFKGLARTLIKTHKGDDKWPLFVNKQLFWWSALIMLDNNDVLTDLKAFFSINTFPHTSISLTGCTSIVSSVMNILTHMTTMLRVGSL